MSDKIIKTYPHTAEFSEFGSNIVPATRVIPEWYKKIPPTFNGEPFRIVINGVPNTTVKSCTPFLDALTAGYTLTLASDVHVTWREGAPHINWKGSRTMVTLHDPEQVDILPVPFGYHPTVFKWHNDFSIDTPKEYSLWCTHPVNRFDLPFQVISGFVDTDLYNLSIHFPFWIKQDWTGVIEKGTPLAQLLPVKRDSWKLEELPVISKEEKFKRSETYRTRMHRAYKHFFWQKKSYK